MSLDYVRAGETVRSSTINSLIGAVAGGGNQSPDLIVTGTPRGPQFAKQAETGSVDLRWGTVFDVANYALSSWPMAKLKLGFGVDDCTGGVAIHGGSGVKTAVSAVVVHKNTSSCPVDGGQLAAEVLEDADFAKDAAQGAAGWVKTKLEGVHPNSGKIKMQLWKADGNYYQVFTNADYEDTRRGLSSALLEKNVDRGELSGLQYFCGWTLAYQTKLSASGGSQVPTSRLVVSHGAKDAYDVLGEDAKAVLKARLACYKVAGRDGELTSYWTWLLPMGPDAEYDQSNEVVHSSQFTFGQDRVLVEAADGDLDDGFAGEATWLGNVSDAHGIKYLDKCVAYGKYEASSNSLSAGELWLNLRYDYGKCAVVGSLGLSAGQGGENQNVLANAVFVARADEMPLGDDVKAGDEAREDGIFFGTLGDLFKDGPKLDAYTPLSAGVYSKSLEWTTREPEEDEAAVSCRCLQLYNFDKAQQLDVTSADWLVGRRYDPETSCAEVVDSPPDVPDSGVDFARTSSVQHRTVLTSDGDGNDVSVKVL